MTAETARLAGIQATHDIRRGTRRHQYPGGVLVATPRHDQPSVLVIDKDRRRNLMLGKFCHARQTAERRRRRTDHENVSGITHSRNPCCRQKYREIGLISPLSSMNR
jgi:hypothetical protein